MVCRKNFVDLSNAERMRLADALNQLYDDGIIASNASMHSSNFNNGIHNGPAFLPWHRYFLLELEHRLQIIDSRVFIPYWDWTQADSRTLEAEPWLSFFGGRANSGGQFDHWSYHRNEPEPNPDGWLPDIRQIGSGATVIIDELNVATYADYRRVEGNSHVPGHNWIGGTMAGGGSPADPLFYLHHCNVDRLWAIWQLNNPNSDQYNLNGTGTEPAAFVPLNDPMVGGATPSSMLDHLALGYRYPVDVRLEQTWAAEGFGLLVAGDSISVELAPPVRDEGLIFNDVPEGETTLRAAVFDIGSCENVTLRITSGPTLLTGPAATEFSQQEANPKVVVAGSEQGRVWLAFTGTDEGDSATGEVIIECDETGGRWQIPISANTVRRPTVGTVLVLDQSGSMDEDAGDGRKRIDVLRESAPVFVDLLNDGDGIGIVRFDHDAYPGQSVEQAGAVPFGAGRTAARSAISSHSANPSGLTSIGDGIELAQEELALVASQYDETAIVVLTDGKENSPKYIADIESLIGDKVFGIGLGEAQHINPAALTALTNDTGGYVMMTGELDTDEYFILQKYYLQILAGVTNTDIVLDPERRVKPGQVHRIAFSLAETDITTDVILLTASIPPEVFAFEVETPLPARINPAVAGAASNITYANGQHTQFYRITLPAVVAGIEERTGEWNVVLELNEDRYKKYMGALADLDPGAYADIQAHGVRCSVNVHSRSNLRMRAKLQQDSLEPGAMMTIRAVLSEYGQPVDQRAEVDTVMRKPDGSIAIVALDEVEPGVFETRLQAGQSGIYRFRLLANGRTFRHREFTREQLLTGAVWREGDQTPPGASSDTEQCLCHMLLCLLEDESIRKWLTARDLDPYVFEKCLRQCCSTSSSKLQETDNRKHHNSTTTELVSHLLSETRFREAMLQALKLDPSTQKDK